MRFLRDDIFKVELLLFESVDKTGVREGTVFFAIQFVFQFGVLHAQRGHMAVVHLILLVVRLDDLTDGVNHESVGLSSPKLTRIGVMRQLHVFWR